MTVSNEFAYGFVPLDSTLAETPSAQSLVLRFTKAPSELPFIQGFKSIGKISEELLDSFSAPPVGSVNSSAQKLNFNLEEVHLMDSRYIELCHDEHCQIHSRYGTFEWNNRHKAWFRAGSWEDFKSAWANELERAQERAANPNYKTPHLARYCDNKDCEDHILSLKFTWDANLKRWIYTPFRFKANDSSAD